MFFIDHTHQVTTFIDPRLPRPNIALKYSATNPTSAPNVRRQYVVQAEEVRRGSMCEEVRRDSMCEEVRRDSMCEEVRRDSMCEEVRRDSMCEEVRRDSMCEEVRRDSMCEEVRRDSMCEEVRRDSICEEVCRRLTLTRYVKETRFLKCGRERVTIKHVEEKGLNIS